MAILPPNIGIDLGTSNVLIYVADHGIALREPSLVVIKDNQRREASAVGEDARHMLGRMPEGYQPVYPIRDGIVADFDLADVMIRYFLKRSLSVNTFGKPNVVMSIPAGISLMERRALEQVMQHAGGKLAHVVESPIAAALGCGLPVYEPLGSMIVDIGAGTTEVAVVSMGSIVVGKTLRLAGNAMDEAIAALIKRETNMLVSDKWAEDTKIDLGYAMPMTDPQRAMVLGIDIVSRLPKTMEIDSDQVYEALQEILWEILAAIIWVLERTPPELGADIMRTGIHLTGGMAQLPGLDQFIAAETGIPVQVARNPMDCTVQGAGYLANHLELLSRIGKNHPLTE